MERAEQILKSASRRDFLRHGGSAAIALLLTRSLPASGRMGRGGVLASTPVFAPNFNSVAAGTTMTSPFTVDRQWGTDAQSAATSAAGGTQATDPEGWIWFAGNYTGAPPVLDTPANIATASGFTFTAPPDGYATMLGIRWLANEAIGLDPWINQPPWTGRTDQGQKAYLCCYVYIPPEFNAFNNAIKWWQLTSGTGTNDLDMLRMDQAGVYYGPGVTLQNNINNNLYAGNPLAAGWHMVEWYHQIESPWGSGANGVVKVWVDGAQVINATSVTFLEAPAITSLVSSGTQTDITLSAAPAHAWAVGNDVAISGVTPSAFNTTGFSKGSAIATVTDTTHFTIDLDSSTFGSYVSGGYATVMGGGGMLAGGLRPVFGGGGTVATSDEWIGVGRTFAAYSSS